MIIQLICGFLGSGKTTLLKNILQHQTSDTAVLVNEFGELGIDGTLISEGQNLNVVEMPSGCICCTLKESLVDAVREIKERQKPARLIIEPTGIAAPSSIVMGLKNADFWSEIELAPIIGIIDMTFFPAVAGDEDNMSNFFKDQIVNSDIILLNKADLVSPTAIEQCREAIADMNPAAPVIPTVYCQTELPRTEARGEVTHFHFSPHWHARAFTFPGIVDRKKLDALLKSVANKEFGEVFRAKGIIDTIQGPATFDYVHGLINYGRIKQSDENKFVFIGRNIDHTKLEHAIRDGIGNGTGEMIVNSPV